jgi:endoglucanase
VVRITSPVSGGTANDWSYQELTGNPDYDCKTFNGMTAYIPVYDNGVLLWGKEPQGGGETPAPTAISTPTPTPAGTQEPTAVSTPAETLGDVDSDGTVTIVDALLTAQFYVGLEPAGFDRSRADVNCNGSIDIVDALLIAQFYVGLISDFC